MMNEKSILTINEAARELNISKPTISRMIHNGQLKTIKIGRIYRIRRCDLEQFVNNSYMEV